MRNIIATASTITNVLVSITSFLMIISIGSLTENYKAKTNLRRRGELYMAIQLLLEGRDLESKNLFVDMELNDIDEEVTNIVTQTNLTSSLSKAILNSKLSFINKYYLVIKKNNLFKKKMKLLHY